MKSGKLTHSLWRFALPSIALATVCMTSCKDELLTGSPEWLGSSIYAELEERGNFSQELALINDPVLSEYPRILSLTGSKTLFVADDAAWEKFFEKNPWGVRSMSDLSEAQKKMLFKSSMLDNAYLLELMSNKASESSDQRPEKGACMRRESSMSLYDSVPLIPVHLLPKSYSALDTDNPYANDEWSELREENKPVLLMSAASATDVVPMVHFLPDYMKANNFTDDDIRIITNGATTSVTGSWVNGYNVRANESDEINRDITCQNGYLHILDGVSSQLNNMADLIASKPQFGIYSAILDRYSTPVYSAQASENYNRAYNSETGKVDKVYVKRYFNTAKNSAYTESALAGIEEINENNHGLLKFDPGWNKYTVYNESGKMSFENDGACMLVPSDKAMNDYALGAGKPLMDRWKSWDKVPTTVLAPMLDNHMFTSMAGCIPSQFPAMVNASGDTLGITLSDIDSCFVGCNGIVYQINRVFVAPAYRSVAFPSMVRPDLSVAYYAVQEHKKDPKKAQTAVDKIVTSMLNYQAYLNSTDSRYCFIIPNDSAFQSYVAPSSYGKSKRHTWAFTIGKTYPEVKVYEYDADAPHYQGKRVVGSQANLKTAQMVYAMHDIMENHIVVLDKDVMFNDPEQEIFQNLAGGPIYMKNQHSWNGIGSETTYDINLAGTFQMNKDEKLPVDSVYDMRVNEGNGVSLVVTKAPLLTTDVTPYATLRDNPAYKNFFELLNGLGSVNTSRTSHAKRITGYVCLDEGLTMLDNYHYTIYIPTNESIEALQTDDHMLPTWEDIELLQNSVKIVTNYDDIKAPSETDIEDYNTAKAALERLADDYVFGMPNLTDDNRWDEIADSLEQVIYNFVMYHIQDNSVYLKGAIKKNANYETACIDPLIFDPNDKETVIGGTGRYYKVQVNYDHRDLTVTPMWNGQPKSGLSRNVIQDPSVSNLVSRQYLYGVWDGGDDGQVKPCTNITSAELVYSSSYVVTHQINAPLYFSEKQYNRAAANSK